MTRASDNAFPSILITEGTEPSAPAAGKQRLYIDSSTHKLKRTDSSGTDVTIEASGSYVSGEMDYVQATSPVTISATTEATANTLVTGSAVSYDGSTTVLVEFSCVGMKPPTTAGAYIQVWLYDGSSSIGELAFVQTATATTALYVPVRGARRLTPSNASHTYSVRANVSTGSGSAEAGAGGAGTQFPMFIRISKV